LIFPRGSAFSLASRRRLRYILSSPGRHGSSSYVFRRFGKKGLTGNRRSRTLSSPAKHNVEGRILPDL
jgi:hypothetical protein